MREDGCLGITTTEFLQVGGERSTVDVLGQGVSVLARNRDATMIVWQNVCVAVVGFLQRRKIKRWLLAAISATVNMTVLVPSYEKLDLNQYHHPQDPNPYRNP